MADTFDFEARLEERLRARAALASRPFDAAEIAHEAIAAGARRRGIGWLTWPARRPAFVWLVVGLLLAIALLGAVTLAGALLRKPPPVPTSGGSNGWVAFAVEGGPSTEGASDIYLVKDGVAERRDHRLRRRRLAPGVPQFFARRHQACLLGSPDQRSSEASLYDVAVVIVTVDAAGMPVGPELRLATPSTDVQDACPEWAPDGQSVAFLTNASGQPPELWIGHLDGTETRVAGWDAIPGGGEFDWSPDGTAVVAVGNDDSSLWIVPVDGGAPRLLTHAAPGVHFHTAQWSPDGTRIAAESYTNPSGSYTVGSIEIYRADGSGSPIELAGGDTSDPSWSPDGRGIAYLQNHSSGPPDIVALMLDTGEVRVLVSHSLLTGGIAGFVWAPDGTRLVLLYGFGDPPAAVFVSVVSDSAPIVLTHTTFDLEGWPDESMISWQSVFP